LPNERFSFENLSFLIKEIKKELLSFLYPPRCVCCDTVLKKKEEGCCPRCAAKLPRITGPVCMKCGKPVADERQEYCADCRKYHHDFDRGTAAFLYTGAMRQSVYRMKACNRRDYLPFYAEAMTSALKAYLPYWQPELIVPIPMHPKKKRQRGYNQSELLAGLISEQTGIPTRCDLLRCVKLTSAQKTLNRSERRENLKGSIAPAEPFPPVKRVLLVDDVYTTGSTMDEAAKILKQNGVESVYFVALRTGKGKKAVFIE
jgi:ComF family protein